MARGADSLKNILVLTGNDYLALALLRGLATKGERATVAGIGGGWLKLSRHCVDYVKVAGSLDELSRPSTDIINVLTRLVRERGISVIVPVDVASEYCAALLKPLLPEVGFFPSAEPETLALLDCKWTFYEFLLAQGLPAPRTWRIDSIDEGRRLPLPLVIKPLAGPGGRGVSVVRDAARLEARLSAGIPVLAQEFLEGEDVDISFLADRGRLVSWAVQTLDSDHVYHYIDDERVVAIARRIAEATRYSGLAHVDMRYEGMSRGSIKVIECNPHFEGCLQCTYGLDVDFIGRGLALAAGESVAAATEGPIGTTAGLYWTAKSMFSGRFSVSKGTRGYLSQKLGDPLPEFFNGISKLLGARD